MGDGYEPVVALPASDDLSHASSDVSDHVDLEEGGHAAEQTGKQPHLLAKLCNTTFTATDRC